MAASKRQQILEALGERLRTISVERGFNTNAGERLCLGWAPELGPDDPVNAIAVLVQDSQPRYQGVGIFETLPFEIQAIAKADLDQPYIEAEAILGDIIAAVEQEDRTLGGLVKQQLQVGPTRTVSRDPGSTTVGIGITYFAPFTRVWGRA